MRYITIILILFTFNKAYGITYEINLNDQTLVFVNQETYEIANKCIQLYRLLQFKTDQLQHSEILKKLEVYYNYLRNLSYAIYIFRRDTLPLECIPKKIEIFLSSRIKESQSIKSIVNFINLYIYYQEFNHCITHSYQDKTTLNQIMQIVLPTYKDIMNNVYNEDLFASCLALINVNCARSFECCLKIIPTKQ